jgi:hypothetical protein
VLFLIFGTKIHLDLQIDIRLPLASSSQGFGELFEQNRKKEYYGGKKTYKGCRYGVPFPRLETIEVGFFNVRLMPHLGVACLNCIIPD